MSEVAQLITAIAALITAIGGATATIILAVQGMHRQRRGAAEEAARLTAEHHEGAGRHRASRRADLDPDRRDRLGRRVVDHGRDGARIAADAVIEARIDALEHPDPPEHGSGHAPG